MAEIKRLEASTVISFLYYIIAFCSMLSGIAIAILGILSITNQNFVENQLSFLKFFSPDFLSSLGVASIAIGISLFALATFFFVLARGLQKNQQWPSIVGIIISVLAVILSINYLLSGDYTTVGLIIAYFNIVINSLIVFYFITDKKIREIFL